MKAPDLKPIFKALSPRFPGFVGILRAIHFDPSAFDKTSFYVSTLVMPLCIPQESLSLLLGTRLATRKGIGWSLDLPDLIEELAHAIKSQGLPMLSRMASPDGFMEVAIEGWGNPHTAKSVAFVLARAGERERAIALINDYLPKLRLDTQWQKDIFDISTCLRDLLVSDPDAADQQLRDWEDYTIQKLQLEPFR